MAHMLLSLLKDRPARMSLDMCTPVQSRSAPNSELPTVCTLPTAWALHDMHAWILPSWQTGSPQWLQLFLPAGSCHRSARGQHLYNCTCAYGAAAFKVCHAFCGQLTLRDCLPTCMCTSSGKIVVHALYAAVLPCCRHTAGRGQQAPRRLPVSKVTVH